MKKISSFIGDMVWSLASLLLMNIVLQIILYPLLNRFYSTDEYGNILYLMGMVNIIAVSVGSSANNSRLKHSREKDRKREYDMFLIILFLVYIPIIGVIIQFCGKTLTFLDIILYWLLLCVTTYRNYGDVEFRLNLDYKGYFLYYLAVSIGYLIGIFVFYITQKWMLLFLTGESLSMIVGFIQNSRDVDRKKSTIELKFVFYSTVALLMAQLLVNMVLNADRFILKIFVNNTAVTIYFIAALLGKLGAFITVPLNSVIIGHLAKRDGIINEKVYVRFGLLVFALGIMLLISCVIASHIYINIFYSDEYQVVKPFILYANAAQIFYFITGIIMTILLRYISERYQLLINSLYGIIFLLSVIPATIIWGIQGFTYAILAVNIFRFLFSFFIGYIKLKK